MLECANLKKKTTHLGNEKFADHLIKYGANVSIADDSGRTALHAAAIHGNSL